MGAPLRGTTIAPKAGRVPAPRDARIVEVAWVTVSLDQLLEAIDDRKRRPERAGDVAPRARPRLERGTGRSRRQGALLERLTSQSSEDRPWLAVAKRGDERVTARADDLAAMLGERARYAVRVSRDLRRRAGLVARVGDLHGELAAWFREVTAGLERQGRDPQ
jgi:hypothetical protein